MRSYRFLSMMISIINVNVVDNAVILSLFCNFDDYK